MDFIDRIKDISVKIRKTKNNVKTEEATKHAFIMPLLQALGYDVFDTMEVEPEYTADVFKKKGEKVDYAIKRDQNPVMLIECKPCNSELSLDNASQLYRYFNATDAKFGILTNGIIYNFYSDLEKANQMDLKPFFTFSMTDFEDYHVKELKKFTKSVFDIDNITETASALKYKNEIKKYFGRNIDSPEDEFVKFFAGIAYNGRMTQSALELFTPIVKEAINLYISERIKRRLESALDEEKDNQKDIVEEDEQGNTKKKGIVTTDEEIQGFQIIKAICSEIVDVDRIYLRDTKSYCGIILDDNNRKPICRLRFNNPNRQIGLFKNKDEEIVSIDELKDIYKYAGKIKDAVKEYLALDSD